jgi:peptide-methionine (S)-S-oxide reductase
VRAPRSLAALAVALLALACSGPAPAAPEPLEAGEATAVFAGGCFWCMEPPFEALDGVLEVRSGYTGGRVENPTYEQVSAGGTGHYEAVEVRYDPARIAYERLLEVFWRNVDPTDAEGQFCDRGESYRTAIFVKDEAERRAAEASKAALEASGRLPGKVVTPVLDAAPFHPAEAYHQDYAKRNTLRYRYYRSGCGRDTRLRALWGAEAGGH